MKLADMSWQDVREILGRRPVGLIPVGAVENHGPHLPLATDWLTANAIAERAAEASDLLLLPGCPVGVSEHHRHFWGTLWLQPDVLREVMLGITRAAASHGLRRLVFVNGHGGNTTALDQATRILRREGIYAFVFEWWNAIPDLIARNCQLPHDHAGDMETSAILAIDPALVRSERYALAAVEGVTRWGKQLHGVQLPLDTVEFTKAGTIGDPSGATAAKGKLFIEASASELGLFCAWLAAQDEGSLASPEQTRT
jgi:creatinine amidohydrolase